jgi:hypothetical protein
MRMPQKIRFDIDNIIQYMMNISIAIAARKNGNPDLDHRLLMAATLDSY